MATALRTVKDSHITAEDVAVMYGVDRYNERKHLACCPFHGDHKPSMTFKHGRFRCWVCDAKGDAIDYVSKYFHISNVDAANKICEDFNISYDYKADRQKETRPMVPMASPWKVYESRETYLEKRISKAWSENREALESVKQQLTKVQRPHTQTELNAMWEGELGSLIERQSWLEQRQAMLDELLEQFDSGKEIRRMFVENVYGKSPEQPIPADQVFTWRPQPSLKAS